MNMYDMILQSKFVLRHQDMIPYSKGPRWGRWNKIQPSQFYIVMVAGLVNPSTISRVGEGQELLIKGVDIVQIKLFVSQESHYQPRGRSGMVGLPSL